MKNNNDSKLIIYLIVLALFSLVGEVMADGLPGEYFVTQRWRDLLAPYSPATNPALMTEENYISVRGAFSPSMGNSFVLYEGGVTVPVGLYQSVGLTMLGVSTNEPIQKYSWDENEGVYQEDGTFTDSHFRGMLSYAINPWNRLSVGANLNFYYDDNFNDAIYGLALDIGVTYRALNHPVLGEHIVGVSFQNVISPDFKGDDIQQQSINTKVSWIGKMWERRIDAGIDLDFKDFTAAATDFATSVIDTSTDESVVVKAAKSFEFDFNARLGFWLMKMVNIYGMAGTGYWGVAAGMNVPTVFGGRDFQVAYQYMSMTDDKLSYTQTIYFRGDFGPHREQVYAKKMAKQAIIGPGKLYNQARQLFVDGQYWDAFFLFGRIATEYPDFFKNDWVKYFMGASQEKMDMREVAAETYNEVITDYSKSPAVFNARLGLIRLNYRDNNSYGVEEQYNELASSLAADSIKQAAAYYMGESKFNEKSYDEAKKFLEMVPMTHTDYPFAQHTLAIISAINNNYDEMLDHLDNVVQFVPETKEQEEIINRSYVMIGYLYYEGLLSSGQSLAKAVAALQSVPSSSAYYIDALLGRAWAALKAGNWNDVKSTTAEIKKSTKNVELQSEADLLLAYSYMVQNTPEGWTKAAQILNDASKAMASYTEPKADAVTAKENEYYNNRSTYYDLAVKANELALVNQSSYVMEQIDSLRAIQKEDEAKVRSFGKFKDAQDKAVFFGKTAQQTKDDIDYALAKAEERASAVTDVKAQEKLKNIDEDIDELQKQLQELQ